MARVLLIEDNPSMREGLTLALHRLGHAVHAAASGEEGLSALPDFRPDAVVLDLMLPGMHGHEVCHRIRAFSQAAIVMATACGQDQDIVLGLEAGADDYVVKPVAARVLDARLRAVLRRVDPTTNDTSQSVEIHRQLRIDRTGCRVWLGEQPVDLAYMELRVLLELSAAPGRVFSFQQLLESVWEHRHYGDQRLVVACVSRLRKRIEDPSGGQRYIHTVRGVGYRFGLR
ncbi:response regulator transcription factor [Streptomyces tubercidicus]